MSQTGRKRLRRRLALYGAAVAAIAALVYGGWFYRPQLGFADRRTEVFRLVGDGRVDEARTLIQEMGERRPDDPRTWLLLGWLEDGLGRTAACRAAYEEALERCTTVDERREVRVTLADLDRRAGRPDEAARKLEVLVDELGESAKTRQLRVLLLIHKGALEEALGEIDRLAEENPVNPHARRLRRHVRRLQEAEVSRDSQR